MLRKSLLVKVFLVWLIPGLVLSNLSFARDWSDASGKYTWSGDLLAASEEVAVLRDSKGKLIAVKTAELSEADRDFVNQYLKEAASGTDPNLQTWTTRKGLKVRGQVMGYKSGPVEIEDRSGTPYINRKKLRDIDPIYQAMLPGLIATVDDSSVDTMDDFKKWVRKLRGSKRTIQVDGVLMKLEAGDEYAVPLNMFAAKDKQVLSNGWQQWNREEITKKEREQEDLLLRTEAAEYQRQQDQAARQNRQIQMMQLGLLAVDAGLTSIWEVQMFPGNGVYGRPMSVVVPAANSSAARAAAMQRYPGYTPGALRQLSRR